jgi:hypothetical protein
MLSKQLEEEIGALAGLPLSDLRQRWADHFGRPAPLSLRHEFLVRAVAYQIQVKALGGLASSYRRQLREIAAALKTGTADKVLKAPRLRPGTRLVRSHAGRVHSILVLEKGFEWEGREFRSLSAVAHAITGTKWNGHMFFGLKQMSEAKAASKGSPRKTEPPHG